MGDSYTDMDKLNQQLTYVSARKENQVLLSALSVCAGYEPSRLAEMRNWVPKKQLTVRETLKPVNLVAAIKEEFSYGFVAILGLVGFFGIAGMLGIIGGGLTAAMFANGSDHLNPVIIALGGVAGLVSAANILSFLDSDSIKRSNAELTILNEALQVVTNNVPTIAYALTVLRDGSEDEKALVEETLPDLFVETIEQVKENIRTNSHQFQTANTIPAITANNNSEPLIPLINGRSIVQDVLHNN